MAHGEALDEFETSLAMKQNAQERGKLVIQFYKRAVQDQQKSDDEGRPIYVERDFIKILTPGDRDNVIDREVWVGRVPACDNMRYPQEYKAFKEGSTETMVGTPLESCPVFSRTQVEELKHLNCRTVEQVASLADGTTQKFMGLQQIKQRAADWLSAAEGGAAVSRLRTENDRLRNELQVKERQLKDLSKNLSKQESEPSDEDEVIETKVTKAKGRKKNAPLEV